MDLFAPGVSLLAAVPWTDSASGLKTGTSMAAPFASGVAALYLESHPVSACVRAWRVCARALGGFGG